jgi:hypothetical protein
VNSTAFLSSVGPVAVFLDCDGAFHRLFADGDSSDFHVFQHLPHPLAVVEAFQDLVGVFELGHTPGVSEVGHFDALEARQDQLFRHPYLGICRNELLFMLVAVSNRDVPKDHFLGKIERCH